MVRATVIHKYSGLENTWGTGYSSPHVFEQELIEGEIDAIHTILNDQDLDGDITFDKDIEISFTDQPGSILTTYSNDMRAEEVLDCEDTRFNVLFEIEFKTRTLSQLDMENFIEDVHAQMANARTNALETFELVWMYEPKH